MRVRWPASQALGSPPPVIVVLADPSGTSAAGPADDTLCDGLCAGLGALVLRASWATRRDDAPDSALERAAERLEWAADHAAELDGDPRRLIVAGRDKAAAAAGALALRARDNGWPRLEGQVLVLTRPCPEGEGTPPPARAGAPAAATIVTPLRRQPLLAAPACSGRRGHGAGRFEGGSGRVSRSALPRRAHRRAAGVTDVNEAELIAAARAGDGRAFAAMLEPYRGELHAHCRRMLRSDHDAEDALQEVMLRAWRALGRFEGRSSLRGWLYKIATNACLNEVDRRRRRPTTSRRGPARRRRADGARVARGGAHRRARAALRRSARGADAARRLRVHARARARPCSARPPLSINSALQRARASIADPGAARSPDPGTARTVRRYVEAVEHDDIDGLVEMLREGSPGRAPLGVRVARPPPGLGPLLRVGITG